jgi:hypothetical protein
MFLNYFSANFQILFILSVLFIKSFSGKWSSLPTESTVVKSLTPGNWMVYVLNEHHIPYTLKFIKTKFEL